jgi:microsomal dipeptidase-like Zn-dependent dipeptidase
MDGYVTLSNCSVLIQIQSFIFLFGEKIMNRANLLFLFIISIFSMLIALGISPGTASAACGESDEKFCKDESTGDRPWCKPGNRVPNALAAKCRALARIAEPATNANQATKYLEQPAGQPLRGYADLHAHMLSNEAFGGLALWGKSFSPGTVGTNFPGGINGALPHDDFFYAYPKSDFGVNRYGEALPSVNRKGQRVHKDHGIFGDILGVGLHDGAGDNSGVALKSEDNDFIGWPKWTSTTHQQMYYKWLERAYVGGMRLMVLLAVNNEVLCKTNKRKTGRNCDVNMQDIDIQINKAYALQGYIDGRNGGAGKGWFKIVKSPAEARTAIENGKLAVVLGIETDSLFECKNAGACTNKKIRDKINEYKGYGVRHIFPVHDFDNQFAGAAAFNTVVNYGNKYVHGNFFSIRECANEGYNFQFDDSFGLGVLATIMLGISTKPVYSQTAHCNAKGLTTKGEFLINELMDAGMIIDIDHMSKLAVNKTFNIAESRDYPLVASHVDVHSVKKEKTERYRTPGQFTRIKDLGGLVGVGMFRGGSRAENFQHDDDNDPSTPPPVPNDCGNSSKVFAQRYLQTVKEMGGVGVALGSDFNGMTQHPGPRFGAEACRSSSKKGSWTLDGAPQTNHVQYPFTISGFGNFGRQETGDRTFDINYDGLAHVGLIPDFLADLKKVGMTDSDLDPLFDSAEAYIQMWEKIEFINSDTTAPVVTAPADIITQATGVQTTVAIGTATATDNVGVTEGPTASTTGPFSLGATSVTWTAKDDAGNIGTAKQTVTVVDTTAPVITGPANVTKEATGKKTSVAIGTATGTDAVGPVTITSNAPTKFDVGDTTVTWTATDDAGNSSTAKQTVTVVDTTAPVITGPANVTKEATGKKTSVTIGTATGTDAVGPVTITSNAPTKFDVGDTTVTWTATDDAGNSSTAIQTVTVEDTTAPVITGPANVTEEATGLQTAVAIGTATGTDAVGPVSITSNAPATFPIGSTTVIWTATDAHNNSSTATQTVTVEDTTAPVIIGPANVTEEATGLQTTVAIGVATGTDAVGPVTITSNAPATFPIGSTTVIWTATDGAGNSSSARQAVTVEDTTAPVITAPVGVTEEATGSQTTVAIGVATGTDAVGPVTITSNAPATFPIGSTTVIWTAIDAYNNSSTATQTVTVVDTTAPVIISPANVIEDATGPLTMVDLVAPTATDAVGVVSLANDAPEAGYPVDSTTTVTWTATDAAGNNSTATQVVTIKPFLLTLNIDKSKVKLHKKGPDKDKIKIKGRYVEFANGDGLNLKEAIVMVNGVSLSKVKFKKNGKFDIEGKHLSLNGIDFSAPVTVTVRIGNDLGRQTILFDNKGKFDDDDKDKDKDEDKGKKGKKR